MVESNESISKKLGVNQETLRIYARRAETNAGERPGLITDERARMKHLKNKSGRAESSDGHTRICR